jgi:hypothetical protein
MSPTASAATRRVSGRDVRRPALTAAARLVAVSMFEIESLVEDSVNTLAASGTDPWELRSLYATMYEFEGRWDTSFTHLRNLDQLVAARFVYRFPLAEHPDYEGHREYFDGLSEFAFIEVGDEGGDGGYTEPPDLYFDAGSPLWRRMVELGRLGGQDAEPPGDIPLSAVALAVATLAEQRGDPELIAQWYRLLSLEMDFEAEPAELEQDPNLAALRAMVRRTDAMSLPMFGSMLADPDPETLERFPALRWWYAL